MTTKNHVIVTVIDGRGHMQNRAELVDWDVPPEHVIAESIDSFRRARPGDALSFPLTIHYAVEAQSVGTNQGERRG